MEHHMPSFSHIRLELNPYREIVFRSTLKERGEDS